MSTGCFTQLDQRFYDSLPAYIYASTSKGFAKRTPKQDAADKPYILLNYNFVDYITCDIDDSSAMDAIFWPEYTLPLPMFMIQNQVNGHAHFLYKLTNGIPKNATGRQRQFLAHIVKGIKDSLHADMVITDQNLLSKNPLACCWNIQEYDSEVSLADLNLSIPVYTNNTNKSYFSDLDKYGFEVCYLSNPGSRNMALFDYGRLRAYRWFKQGITSNQLTESILEALRHVNSNDIPICYSNKGSLPDRELISISRSITRYCDNHRSTVLSSTKNVGAMGLPKLSGLSIEEYEVAVKLRQSAGAAYSHNIRINDTQEQIRAAVGICQRRGIELSKYTIMEHSKLSKSTVNRYWEFICKVIQEH